MRTQGCATLLAVMAERNFKILAYADKVPTMACCEKCQIKFFTLPSFRLDHVRAEHYLRDKFAQHKCLKPNPGMRLV